MTSQSLVNSDFFINCSTPESAYLLGLIWGDGYLYKREYIEKRIGKNKTGFYNKKAYHVKIECTDLDLSSLIDIFNFSGKWSSCKRSRPNRKPQLCLSTCNKALYDFLYENNYNNKSGGNPNIIDVIPNELLNYWWRGYFDADGCLHKLKNGNGAQVSISSTYDQDWSAAINLLDKLDSKHTIQRIIRNEKSKYSSIRLTSKKSILAFLNYIYSGEKFGLKRKIDTYKSIIANWSHLA